MTASSPAHRVRNVLNRLLRPFDASLHRRSTETPAARARFLDHDQIAIVLDVGAHRGQYGRELRDNGYSGVIHSFEPLPEPYAELSAATLRDRDWRSHNLALGAGTATLPLRIAGNETSSSLLPMLPSHKVAAPESLQVGQIGVTVRALDDLTLELDGSRCAMKLDVQGAERLVLAGAQRTLESIHLLEIELSIVELYEGQDRIFEQAAYLTGLGFRLIWIERGFQDRRTGELLQVDGIFRRTS